MLVIFQDIISFTKCSSDVSIYLQQGTNLVNCSTPNTRQITHPSRQRVSLVARQSGGLATLILTGFRLSSADNIIKTPCF